MDKVIGLLKDITIVLLVFFLIGVMPGYITSLTSADVEWVTMAVGLSVVFAFFGGKK